MHGSIIIGSVRLELLFDSPFYPVIGSLHDVIIVGCARYKS
jgi:hypothetical protein